MLDIQCREGEEFYLNCPRTATHIINNEPVTITPEPIIPTEAQLLSEIRLKRNKLLTSSDWTQLEDFPHGVQMKQQWKVYRQALRNFPSVCDPVNPVWPVAPV